MAALDRLVHHGHIVGIKGESYRQKAAAARVSSDAPGPPMSLTRAAGAAASPHRYKFSPSAAARPAYPDGMDLFARISIDPAVRFGKPCVRGTRLTVGDVLGTLAAGSTEAQLLEDFPQLTHEDVLACLAYAAEREKRLVTTPAAV